MYNLTVLPAAISHLDEITAIEELSFSNPWSKQSFAEGLEKSEFYTTLTALYGNKLVGYICLFHLYEDGELLNIAVHPDYRGKGIAQALIDSMYLIMKEKGVTRIFLEVRESNTAARKLYEKNMFLPVNVRKNYYSNPFEDGIVMQKLI